MRHAAKRLRQWIRRTALAVLPIPVLTGLGPIAAAQSQPTTTSAPDLNPRDMTAAFAAALATINPSVVKIETVGGAQHAEATEQRGPAFRAADGPTTGILWTADGYILTSSFNFIRDPLVITVETANGHRYVAKLLARDRVARLALLKIEGSGLMTPTLAEPETLRPGFWLLTVGFGQGGEQPSLSVGVVSGLRRMHGLALQTDAKTSPVNYGGPAFDISGRLAGICVPIGPGSDELAGVEWYDSGIGFAITVDQLRKRFERLKSGTDLERGMLGVTMDELTPPIAIVQATTRPASQPGSGESRGADENLRFTLQESSPCGGLLVAEDPIGPAAAVGLQAADCIVSVDGAPVRNLLEFRRVMANKFAGDKVEVGYVRAGERHSLSIKLAAERELKP